MSRYRPPAPRSSPYVTSAGYEALKTELLERLALRRDVVKHLSAAAAEGDRSENAEYIYRKKQLRELDRRIGYLQRRMPKLTVVSPATETPQRARFGVAVTLLDEGGVETTYRIVGADEIDTRGGRISVDAPLARALLGRAVDDEVEVDTPGGRVRYVVAALAP